MNIYSIEEYKKLYDVYLPPLNLIREYVENGLDIIEMDRISNLLIHASFERDIHTIRYLLEQGVSPNNKENTYIKTALHWSIYHSCHDATKLLLDYGANPLIKDNVRFVPLCYGLIMDKKSIKIILNHTIYKNRILKSKRINCNYRKLIYDMK